MPNKDNQLCGKKILVIDDDVQLLQIFAYTLAKIGCTVYTATDGPAGLQQFYNHRPDLVILDVVMPGMNGWDVCRRIRQCSAVPLLMLTGLREDDDVVKGLEHGADDYLTKPVVTKILLARAVALLRRAAQPLSLDQNLHYHDDYLTLDLNHRQVLVQGQPIGLTEREYELLAYLCRHADQVRPHQQILADIWGSGELHSADLVHKNIRRLRQKLEADPHQPQYLLTEHGVGYRFQKQVS
jgi:DNA-binding response OmpR family regulator